MSILDWFANKEKKETKQEKLNIPGNLWIKCPSCSDVVFHKELEKNSKVCMACGHHFRLTAEERIAFALDTDSFVELHTEVRPLDPLKFTDTEPYEARIKKAVKKVGRNDAVIVGYGKLKKKDVNIAVMDFSYMGGSMGSVVGEKITRIIERAIETKHPLLIFCSSGGARMQEGILSLMQMAKTSAALARLAEVRVPYFSILCDPTTGGVSASFAMLGDINIAEPDALISFAGPRVIEQTIRQKLPEGFQRSEFLLEHGMVDLVLPRAQMRDTLSDLILSLDPHQGEA